MKKKIDLKNKWKIKNSFPKEKSKQIEGEFEQNFIVILKEISKTIESKSR